MFCCDTCPKYEECERNDQLKEDCCPQCPEYDSCVGSDNTGESGDTDSD